ncbi:hypothetical protein [Terricaulis silvestris]|uniref:SmpA / OmlA family protein n=1 Tax=Terricaulis silvestris TaxID=2686094 RepID=A0A6I6MPJ3_9CAUL|nr:hypothetical protein [Terricaulis silvestris]QGZ95298.1 hypothetical protein DSM104635_02147 [Terricaulis silvestris]
MGVLFKSAVVAAILALLAYAAIAMPLPFVSAWWNCTFTSQDHSALNVRHRIADGLVITRSLVGDNREAVERLLGAPLKPPYNGLSTPSSDMVYYLGPERGFIGIDSEWLIVRFDGSQRVSRVIVRSD